MSTSTSPAPTGQQVTWAPVARVNLLPREIDEGRKFRRLQRVLAGCVVVTVLAMGGLYLQARSSVGSAQSDLDQTQSRATSLATQQQTYQEVPKVTAELEAAQAARASVLSGDVIYNRLLDDIVRARPSGLSVDSMDVAPVAAADGSTGTAGAVTTTAGALASLSLSGTAKDLGQVSSWMTTLGNVAGLTGVVLVSASSGGGTGAGTSYSLTASVTQDALSKRYDVEAS